LDPEGEIASLKTRQSRTVISLPSVLKTALSLKEAQILVWTAELDYTTDMRFEQLARLLSREETQKATI